MAYDLRRESWIPWRRRSAVIEWGPPALLVDRLDDDPVVALAAPRPDFDGALQEFLIGLLTVALQPRDEEEWAERWDSPPTVDELQAALDALPPAFDLDGDGPRFFQDFSPADLEDAPAWSVEGLLIGAPGTEMDRPDQRAVVTDLFVKRGRVERLSRPAAAMALLTLQTYSPEGGRGHRTGLRGGGPLTTLVDPRVGPDGQWRPHEQPLWRKLWANVETIDQWAQRTSRSDPPSGPADVFPWLGPTRTSDPRGGPTTPDDVHPLQAYFGLPRRIRLEFDGPGECPITGRTDERTATGFRMSTYGVQYLAWNHPLSPYRTSPKGEWFPVHGQPGGVGWRDWIGLTLRAPEGSTQRPAAVVSGFTARARVTGSASVRLHAFGYDMKSAKAREWADAVLPMFAVADEARRALLADTAARLTDATGIVASALLSAVQRALFQRPEDAPGDLSQVKTELWTGTEATFYALVGRLANAGATGEQADVLRAGFARALEMQATRVFDHWCADGGTTPEALRRLVAARFNLVMTLRGYSKLGEKLFAALRSPLPGGGRAGRAAKSRSRKEAKT